MPRGKPNSRHDNRRQDINNNNNANQGAPSSAVRGTPETPTTPPVITTTPATPAGPNPTSIATTSGTPVPQLATGSKREKLVEAANIRQPSPADKVAPASVKLGPVTVRADYTNLEKYLSDLQNYFNRVDKSIGAGQGTPLWPRIAGYEKETQEWLSSAIYLYLQNGTALPDDFDHRAAIERLVVWAPKHSTKPRDQYHNFEREALGVSGWTAAALPRQLPSLTTEEISSIRAKFSATDSTPTGELRDDVLKEQLLPKVEETVAKQAEYWRPPPGGQLLPESMDALFKLADLIQRYTARRFQPYADGRPDGPFYTGFSYSKQLGTTHELHNDTDSLLNYMMNRTEAIGWDPVHGRLLAAARYDKRRPGDEQRLRDLIKQRLEADAQHRENVALAHRHTGAHGADKISISPVFPGPAWGKQKSELEARIQWRWRVIRTLVHELLHRLAHPAFNATATDNSLGIRDSQIIKEGFVDLLTADVFTHLWKDFENAPQLLKNFFGGIADPQLPDDTNDPQFVERIKSAYTPDDTFFDVGYGGAGESALEIYNLVGDDRVRAAYFLGAIHLVGLDRS